VGEDTLLINPAWIDAGVFEKNNLMEVDPTEPAAANVLLIGNALLASSQNPRTLARLESKGLNVIPVDSSELAKAEGGLTCCSLIVPGTTVRGSD
jgi:dimethylargininase